MYTDLLPASVALTVRDSESFEIEERDGLTARRVYGAFLGVEIPDDVAVYDTRTLDDELFSDRAPYGETLYGSEVPAYVMGLRQGYGAYHYDSTPTGSTFYFDAREERNEEEAAKVLRGLLERFASLREQYDRADEEKPQNGGSIHHKPVAVTLSNFGGSVIGDRRALRHTPFSR